MTVLTEGHLQITLPPGVVGRKFDDASHGLSHCMQAVDFIIDLPDQIWFVEFRDPEAGTEPNQKYIEQFRSGTLDHELKTKLRDSWLYEWACGRTGKPIHFYVVIGASNLKKGDLLTRTDQLKKKIPFPAPKKRGWHQTFIAGCLVMNLATWNQTFPDYPVRRIRP
ncbi:MAG: hypothetical protein HQL91_02455 [Magnetococcales bacterium]|nr:hypothetical protein [Magnetococcales bacterium]